jgi:hypothetical protein
MDTLPKVRAFYLRPVRERAQREKERLQREVEAARQANERPRLRRLESQYEHALATVDEMEAFDRTLQELQKPKPVALRPEARWVDRAIAEVRANGYHPILDHGVRVNIEPLKEARLLPKSAERVK